jgi:hypothetical protein
VTENAPSIDRDPAGADGFLTFQVRDPEGNLWDIGTYGPRFEFTDEGSDTA